MPKKNAMQYIKTSHQRIIPTPKNNVNITEKLCLQWDDFREHIKYAFGNFNDVTLVCEDGQHVEAHKVVLAASSPFFQKLLGRNKHPHPLIFIRGVKFDDLSAIVDFLYRGEANVYQESLDSFLAISEELQLRSLMKKTAQRFAEYHDGGLEEYLPPTSSSQIDLPKTGSKKEATNNKIARTEGNTTAALPSYHSGDLDQ